MLASFFLSMTAWKCHHQWLATFVKFITKNNFSSLINKKSSEFLQTAMQTNFMLEYLREKNRNFFYHNSLDYSICFIRSLRLITTIDHPHI